MIAGNGQIFKEKTQKIHRNQPERDGHPHLLLWEITTAVA